MSGVDVDVSDHSDADLMSLRPLKIATEDAGNDETISLTQNVDSPSSFTPIQADNFGKRWFNMFSCTAGKQRWIASSIVALVLLGSMGAVIGVMHAHHPEPPLIEPNNALLIQPNDLWGMHDLLMVGYAAVFETPDTEGHNIIQQSAITLAQLLPALHPYAPCRNQLASHTGQGSELVVRQAKTSWQCLPHTFTTSDFKDSMTFDAECLDSPLKARTAKFPVISSPAARNALSSCKYSKWDRTCSYWSTIHSLTLRAEALSSPNFLQLLVTILWGGVTQCAG